MRKYIYPYSGASQSAMELAVALEVTRIRRTNSKFRGNATKLVINWGCSELSDEALSCEILNLPTAVQVASNKLTFLQAMGTVGIRTPPFTTEKTVAQAWVNNGYVVVARTLLRANSGRGIVMCEPNQPIEVDAPLYTMYKKKFNEYRIHVLNGEVISSQRKALPNGFDREASGADVRIRSHDNGFVFVRNDDHEIPTSVTESAIDAVTACGLNFGAVDVIFNDHEQLEYVLEVNTAPGLTGTTLEDYAEAFGEL